MKTIISMLTVMGFVLGFGATHALAGDSLINILDPSKVAGYVELETGSVTLTQPAPGFIERGSAAGGMMKEPDTFLTGIDPSGRDGLAKALQVRGPAAGVVEHDTLPSYITGDENKIVN
jgi:hypothetical protein